MRKRRRNLWEREREKEDEVEGKRREKLEESNKGKDCQWRLD